MVRIRAFQARGPGSIPGRRNRDLEQMTCLFSFLCETRRLGVRVPLASYHIFYHTQQSGFKSRQKYILRMYVCMYTTRITMVEWPSGLRRQVKALISSEARVRIPSQPRIFYTYTHATANSEIRTRDLLFTKQMH